MATRLETTLDPNLYTQIGLDSASLTMLGTIVHQLSQPGVYRGALHHGADVKAIFFITADNNSPVAQVTIDLAGLEKAQSGAPSSEGDGSCGCTQGSNDPSGQRYTVNPRGYVQFHVKSGQGGYYVHLRGIEATENDRGYDTRTLQNGDAFTAMILRPGTYSIHNTLTKAAAEVVVHYPKVGNKPYIPPLPVRIECTAGGFDTEGRINLGVGQGLIFHARTDSRIEIKLEKPDDGPPRTDRGRTGYRKLQSA
jgi:hypothetical protein